MDMIYSRRRIRLPKMVYKKFNNTNNSSKKIKFISIIIFAIVTFTVIIKSINPIFENLCKDKARSIATVICNEETTKIIKNYSYDDLVTIHKDKEENITMIKSNITTINFIISDVAEKITKRIDGVKKDEIGIRIGSFTGSKLLSGIGPEIPIKLSTVGNIQSDLQSEFKQAGINQTIHRIYLQIDCEITILSPYNNINESISNQVLIAENIIVGRVPESYYNLEGISQDNITDVIK